MPTEIKTLSEKIKTAFDVDNDDWKDNQGLIKIEDVKEFIRLDSGFDDDVIDKLSEHFCKCEDGIEICPKDERCDNCKFIESILRWRAEKRDKIAGDKLI